MSTLWWLWTAKERQGDRDSAADLLKKALELARAVDDRRLAATWLEALTSNAGGQDGPRVAVILMAAADALGPSVGCSALAFPNLTAYHDECERRARQALDTQALVAAR
jgi:hypothetical protein